MKVKPLAMAVWTRDTENVSLRPLAAKGSMNTNSMSVGHTKLRENYTVKCSSATGIVAFGTSNAWLPRQPSVGPTPGCRDSTHCYITIWYLPQRASTIIKGPCEVPAQ
eukprot:6753227-Heterocapsa_arctica.AAC.1